MKNDDINLFYSRTVDVESAYIITLKDNFVSEKYSARCQSSCQRVNMPYKIWDAFDGTKNSDIVVPKHSQNDSLIKILKVTDHYLTKGEVACALSHISLWRHCAILDKPIVILEHDTVVVKKFSTHDTINSIIYLGGAEWAKQNWPILMTPPYASEGPNYYFICRAHAYSIDPLIAKNLLAHVIKYGICAPLDIMMRVDLFNITHKGLFAYDDNINDSKETTIKKRPITGRTTERNDRLKT